jgi:phosphatidylserine decarboxylase
MRTGVQGPLAIKIRNEGLPFVGIFAAATVLMFLASQSLGWIGVILTIWCACFFRDPDRVTPQDETLVISPADGVIQMIVDAAPPPELGMDETPLKRISVFMNVFDCHVNRMPVNAEIVATAYRPGKFVNASLDKASVDNERRALFLRMADGKELAVVQIAGLVARRILCWGAEGQRLKAGEKFGMIRFGSRVDVYLPPGSRALVAVGQRAVAGETVLARLDDATPDRTGEIR